MIQKTLADPLKPTMRVMIVINTSDGEGQSIELFSLKSNKADGNGIRLASNAFINSWDLRMLETGIDSGPIVYENVFSLNDNEKDFPRDGKLVIMETMLNEARKNGTSLDLSKWIDSTFKLMLFIWNID